MDYRTEVGDLAPDFTTKTTDDTTLSLSDYKNKMTVILLFFDHNDERCLQKLSSVAADYEKFKSAGAVILPVALTSPESGKKLAGQLNLPFPVISDTGHYLVRMYKAGQCSNEAHHVCFDVITAVTRPLLLIIDTSGVIRFKHELKAPGGQPSNDALLMECREALK